jgi:hypothetical protein
MVKATERLDDELRGAHGTVVSAGAPPASCEQERASGGAR